MTEQLGRYEILEEIGQGGFAIVHRAKDTELNRLVALKELRPTMLQDADWVRRFKREARTIAGLDHHRIVTIHDVIDLQNRLFIVMCLVDGSSLDEVIAANGAGLPWSEAIEIFSALAEGLDFAHQQDILHRDLKPANVLIDLVRGPLLTDFGLAKLEGGADTSMTAGGGIVGTPHYIAPEVWEGQGSSKQSDIYAMGCILYEMLTGQVLFGGDSPPMVMMAHFNPPTLLHRWPEDVPPGLTEVLLTALAREPGERYSTAAEMVAALVKLGSVGPTEARPQPSQAVERVTQLPSFLEAETEEVEAPVFVSREAELARLNDFLDKALAGQGQLVFVTGEAGQGKTSLVSEFARRALANHPQLLVANGTCDVYTGVGDPYLPFRDLLRMLTGDVEAQAAAGAINREQALRLWHFLPDALRTVVEDGPELIDIFISGSGLLGRAASLPSEETAWLPQLREQLEKRAEAMGSPDQSRLFEACTTVLKSLAARRVAAETRKG